MIKVKIPRETWHKVCLEIVAPRRTGHARVKGLHLSHSTLNLPNQQPNFLRNTKRF